MISKLLFDDIVFPANFFELVNLSHNFAFQTLEISFHGIYETWDTGTENTNSKKASIGCIVDSNGSNGNSSLT